jgi:tetratricopeptide (TPR) repeat protein
MHPGGSRRRHSASRQANPRPLHHPEIALPIGQLAKGVLVHVFVGRSAETAALTRVLAAARRGVGQVLVLEGEPGIGKTALLEFARTAAVGMQIARAAGVQPETDIPYSGLHQLLLPFQDGLDRISDPHQKALGAALGLTSDPPRDQFFVGMAALALLSDAAMRRPVLCLVDDAHQLDRESIDALGFAARRVLADRLAMIFTVRGPEERVPALHGLDRIRVSGLDAGAALELVGSVADHPVDGAVADRIVSDTHGHPLAIIEVVRELSPQQLEGVAPIPKMLPLAGRLEDLFVARVRALTADDQRLLLVVAADPSGDLGLIWRAAERLGVKRATSGLPPALEQFVSCSPRVSFHHPLMRSAAYYARSGTDRRRAHEALAAASDPVNGSDHRAWRRAAAAVAPNEGIARDLERSAEHARSCGGWASAATFLARAGELTPDDSTRVARTLAGAHAWLLAGHPGAARSQLEQTTPALADPASRCRAAWLEGMIEFTSGRPAEAASALLAAAKMCADHDARAARDTLLTAFDAAHLAGVFADVGLDQVLAAARAIQLNGKPWTVGDALLDGFAELLASGDAVGVPALRRTVDNLSSDQPITEDELTWLPVAWIAAIELYDDRTLQALTGRWATAARVHGSVAALPVGLGRMPHCNVVVGHFAAAERMVAEARDLAAATQRAARPGGHGTAEVSVLAWRGREQATRDAAATLIPELTCLGRGAGVQVVYLALTILELGLGNYREALRAARRASPDGQPLHLNAGPELIEATVRCGELDAARGALDRLAARVEAGPTDWGVGVLLRSRAMLADRDDAEELYRAAIDHLSRTLILPQLGRTHLLFGEWLRRERRRRDAREQLRMAFELLGDLGADAFADRARAELMATGEHARRRAVETLDQLTPQEEQVARLASEGLRTWTSPSGCSSAFRRWSTTCRRRSANSTSPTDKASRKRWIDEIPRRAEREPSGGRASLTAFEQRSRSSMIRGQVSSSSPVPQPTIRLPCK